MGIKDKVIKEMIEWENKQMKKIHNYVPKRVSLERAIHITLKKVTKLIDKTIDKTIDNAMRSKVLTLPMIKKELKIKIRRELHKIRRELHE